MTRKELAAQYFLSGYNCSQSVVLAFSDLLNTDKDTLLKISSSFGGGMGRLREVCGAVTGMFIVTGLLFGYTSPEDSSGKSEHYFNIQGLAKSFSEKNGSFICRELLNLSEKESSHEPEKRTESYYKKRPCKELVAEAAEILENFLSEKGIDV